MSISALDAIDPATEEALVQALGPEVTCPLCGSILRRDRLWSRPYFVDEHQHGYSNVRVLIQELHERGRLPATVAALMSAVSPGVG